MKDACKQTTRYIHVRKCIYNCTSIAHFNKKFPSVNNEQNLICTSNGICTLNLHRLSMKATVMEYQQTNLFTTNTHTLYTNLFNTNNLFTVHHIDVMYSIVCCIYILIYSYMLHVTLSLLFLWLEAPGPS